MSPLQKQIRILGCSICGGHNHFVHIDHIGREDICDLCVAAEDSAIENHIHEMKFAYHKLVNQQLVERIF
jgi:hypothetical protein